MPVVEIFTQKLRFHVGNKLVSSSALHFYTLYVYAHVLLPGVGLCGDAVN